MWCDACDLVAHRHPKCHPCTNNNLQTSVFLLYSDKWFLIRVMLQNSLLISSLNSKNLAMTPIPYWDNSVLYLM